jgi:hypothetical protein
VQRNDIVYLETQPVNVLDQIRGERRSRTRVRIHRGRIVGIGLDQQLLGGQIDHQQRLGVRAALDVVDLDGSRAVAQHALRGDALDGGGAHGARERIGDDRMPAARKVLEERRVLRLGDHGEPFGDGGA